MNGAYNLLITAESQITQITLSDFELGIPSFYKLPAEFSLHFWILMMMNMNGAYNLPITAESQITQITLSDFELGIPY